MFGANQSLASPKTFDHGYMSSGVARISQWGSFGVGLPPQTIEGLGGQIPQTLRRWKVFAIFQQK